LGFFFQQQPKKILINSEVIKNERLKIQKLKKFMSIKKVWITYK